MYRCGACYDVNSLYPTSMANNKFPAGQTYEFVGDINLFYKLENSTWNKDNSYFIAESSVETTKDLYQPYLQINHLGKDQGLSENRTIAPNGSFDMKINSCEYHNAINKGDYNIITSKGYLWFSKSIFNNYVNDIYTLRCLYPKDDPMNLICKYLLNSLFGRFAMKPIESITEFIPRDLNIINFLENNIIESEIEIDEDYVLLTYRPNNEDILIDRAEYSNSICIASAITAYARVFMSKRRSEKKNPDFKLLYSDKGSIFYFLSHLIFYLPE